MTVVSTASRFDQSRLMLLLMTSSVVGHVLRLRHHGRHRSPAASDHKTPTVMTSSKGEQISFGE